MCQIVKHQSYTLYKINGYKHEYDVIYNCVAIELIGKQINLKTIAIITSIVDHQITNFNNEIEIILEPVAQLGGPGNEWNNVQDAPDIQTGFTIFHTYYINILYEYCFPLTKKKVKYDNRHEWINPGIRKSITKVKYIRLKVTYLNIKCIKTTLRVL